MMWSASLWNCSPVTPMSSQTRGLLELRVTMGGVGRHDELGQLFTLLITSHSVSPDVEHFSRSSEANLDVEITDDDLEKVWNSLQNLPKSL
ncbi:unnamed protein product [Haemonchus placei]|uniref:ACT domain-containing protein n=1 Tax=Haemonchus placei TaxID=6290 RepID=A0A0N4XAN5_HAEPC|nr:unnamed protein product [Haemonchus placei]